MWLGYAGAVGALLLAGCGGAAQVMGPQETLRTYAQYLESGKVDEAYMLLSDEARREMSLEAFRRMVKETPDEMKDIARSLSRPASPANVTATVSTPDGETLVLVYEAGRWRVDSSAINIYSQATPQQAVQAFLRAFERGRYDVLMRFVPDAKKPGLDAAKLKQTWEGPQKDDIQRTVAAVKSALPTATFEVVGDRATMPFGAGGTVQLVREHGVWKIEDFD
jgi:hypothetical protein